LLCRFREIDIRGGGIERDAGGGHGLRLLLLFTLSSFEGCALGGATDSTVGHDGNSSGENEKARWRGMLALG
jgi:hypothetical protein